MSMGELLDFLIYIVEDDQEQKLWQIWLHKPIELGYDDWKRSLKPAKVKNRISKVEEQKAFEVADRILKMKQFEELKLV